MDEFRLHGMGNQKSFQRFFGTLLAMIARNFNIGFMHSNNMLCNFQIAFGKSYPFRKNIISMH